MNEENENAESENTDSENAESENAESENSAESINETLASSTSVSGLRKAILLVGLVVVLGLFAYDQLITKRDFNVCKTTIGEMQTLTELNGTLQKAGDHDGDGVITPVDVKKTAGRDPSTTADLGENYLVETYSWPRVIPGLTYNVFAVYRKGEKQNILFQVADQRPDPSTLPKPPKIGEPGSVPNPVLGGAGPPPQDQGSDAETNSSDDENEGDGDSSDGDSAKAPD